MNRQLFYTLAKIAFQRKVAEGYDVTRQGFKPGFLGEVGHTMRHPINAITNIPRAQGWFQSPPPTAPVTQQPTVGNAINTAAGWGQQAPPPPATNIQGEANNLKKIFSPFSALGGKAP